MTHTLFLSAHDISGLIQTIGVDSLMDDLIDHLERACRHHEPGRCEIPPRTGFHYQDPHPGLVEWMPLMGNGNRILMKMVGYHPENPETYALPTILCTLAMFDARTGHLIAIADGTLLTALRTGAASALASRLLAAPESRTLGLIGAGAQAVTQLHALSREFPLVRVLVHDVNPDRASGFARRVAPFAPDSLTFETASVDRIVAESDILCTATSIEPGAGPLFKDNLSHKPCLHINAVGADFPGKFELPQELLRRSFVCPDFREQVEREGECQQLDNAQIGPELPVVAKSPAEFEQFRTQLSVFDSTGFALEDLVATELILQRAEEHGIGRPLPFESIPSDPYNPYEAVVPEFTSARAEYPPSTPIGS